MPPALWLFLLAQSEHVIPPGREPLVLAMLGGHDTLAGDCRLAGASIDRGEIHANYTCGPAHAPVSLVLAHPEALPAARAHTARFALDLTAPESPASTALLAEVTARVATYDSRWSWTAAFATAITMPRTLPGAGSSLPPPAIGRAIVLGVPALAVALRIALSRWNARRAIRRSS